MVNEQIGLAVDSIYQYLYFRLVLRCIRLLVEYSCIFVYDIDWSIRMISRRLHCSFYFKYIQNCINYISARKKSIKWTWIMYKSYVIILYSLNIITLCLQLSGCRPTRDSSPTNEVGTVAETGRLIQECQGRLCTSPKRNTRGKGSLFLSAKKYTGYNGSLFLFEKNTSRGGLCFFPQRNTRCKGS